MVSFVYKSREATVEHGQGLERNFLMMIQLDFLII